MVRKPESSNVWSVKGWLQVRFVAVTEVESLTVPIFEKFGDREFRSFHRLKA